jgi:uncharacterized protein
MKVAIVGGGASGMVTAYLLDQQGHEVTVFERQASLGGHIRTLNKMFSPIKLNVTRFWRMAFWNFRRCFIIFWH